MAVLATFGGIWMDGTIACTEPLRWVHDAGRTVELVGFSAPHTVDAQHPILENWFFACTPHSAFMRDWLNEVRFMTMFPSEGHYMDYVERLGWVNMQPLKQSLPYLITHLCASVVQQREPGRYRLRLQAAESTALRYLAANGYRLPEALEELCSRPDLQTPIVKFRGRERVFLEANPRLRCDTHHADLRHVLGTDLREKRND